MIDDQAQRTTLDSGDWVRGAADAPNVLLEYGDFECPYCASTFPVLHDLVDMSSGAVKLVFRHYPITTSHAHALNAAEAAEAAGAQNRFWEMHDILFCRRTELGFDNLREYAAELGLDVARFVQQLEGHRHLNDVESDFRRGMRDGVHGTPTLFINGYRYDGTRDVRSLLAAIAKYAPPNALSSAALSSALL